MPLNPKYLILLFVFVTSLTTYGQTKTKRERLEARRVQLQKDQVWINALLSNAQRKEQNLLVELKDIKDKITARQEVIDAITAESNELSDEIYLNQLKINSNERELKALKKDYGEMIYKSYKSKSQTSRLMFLLSSDNFAQAYKRFQYMKQYTNFRKSQGEEIIRKTDEIEQMNDSLKVKKEDKQQLLDLKLSEQNAMEGEQKQQQRLINQIKQKENRYKRQIKQIQKEEEQVNAQIEKLIRDAIVASNKAAGKTTSSGAATFALTPEAKALASKFSANKGKLPWPVEKGYVSTYFGLQPHPFDRTVKFRSNGVRITTAEGSMARSVFEGTILEIQVMPGNKKAVLVQHGDYITVYKKLETVLVKKGEKVKTGQNLGVVFTDKVSGKTILDFVLSQNTKFQNPKSWIYKM